MINPQIKLLLGDEAVAQGAIDAGVSGIYGYPGTPSTEIITYAQRTPEVKEKKVIASWTVNEKTAMETALGMSYAGKRTIVTMKHVGLNVAADAFINSAISGVNGGLLVVVADDPSMHSSQNEQDSRVYGRFAMVPIIEPTTGQETYEMMRYAFELSERVKLPVLFRLTTRLAHSRTGVKTGEKLSQNHLDPPQDTTRFILLPSNAKGRYNGLIKMQEELEKFSENSKYNKFSDGTDTSLGIIACGIAYTYLMDNFLENPNPYPTLKVNQYPLPMKQIRELFQICDKILVLEEGYPVVEEYLRNNVFTENDKIVGKLTGILPRTGELNTDHVAHALGLPVEVNEFSSDAAFPRPPAMCVGCGHRDLYDELNEISKQIGSRRIFSDIGCYTLGALPPYEAIDTCIDMGASITMAKGAADAGIFPAIAVIGDSTFTHSGITGLLDAVNDKANITVLISDNYTTAMTGGQDTAATGRIADICRGVGVEEEHLKLIVPLKKNLQQNIEIIKNEINHHGVSVIIAQRECVKFYKKM
ncbi:MAG: indolepyruvate ferredoxin oxidoreductase [Saprospiraceae bacterium]|nr:indolepyruvate ferredoxin oxidoreductase [Saprospiraceae bacterium]